MSARIIESMRAAAILPREGLCRGSENIALARRPVGDRDNRIIKNVVVRYLTGHVAWYWKALAVEGCWSLGLFVFLKGDRVGGGRVVRTMRGTAINNALESLTYMVGSACHRFNAA